MLSIVESYFIKHSNQLIKYKMMQDKYHIIYMIKYINFIFNEIRKLN